MRDDINLDDRMILIRTSKNRKPKYIAFSKDAIKYLKEWLQMTKHIKTDYLFPQQLYPNKHINRTQIYDATKEIDAAVYPRIKDSPNRPNGAHVLRHTFVQEWCEKGGDLRGLQWILGWSSLGPLDSYLRMNPELIKEHYRKFEQKKWKRKER